MNGARTRVVTLAGCVLPGNGPWLRNHVRPPERRTPHYLERFDRTTLFYDAVQQDDGGRVLFTAPPFANLWPLFRDGLRDDGRRVRPSLRRAAKYAQASLPRPHGALTLDLGDGPTAIAPRRDLAAAFEGLNTVVTINRDNPLDAVTFWAVHHVRLHRLEAVLIYDNGSTRYAPEALAEALAAVPGLKRVVVAEAPFPYGTTDPVRRGEVRPNYLQPALLNLARTDILRRARAVLNADIDEIVLSRDGRSVFDLAAGRWHGAARLPVYWADPPPEATRPAPQSAHTWRSAPKKRTPRKWCARPRGPLSRLGWHVHHLGGEVFKLLPEDRAQEVVHCRATTTGWNPRKARLSHAGAQVPDPELEALWPEAER